MKMFSIPVRAIIVSTVFFLCVGLLIYVMMEKRTSGYPLSRDASNDLESIRSVHAEVIFKSSRHPVSKGKKPKKPKMKDHITISLDLPTLPPNIIKGIKTFAFFIGYPRSGHSIVGSILDAHPHIVMSHEFMFFERWSSFYGNNYTSQEWTANLFNMIYQKSYRDTLPGGAKHVNRTQKGYTLAIDSLWQGKFNEYVEVIGDKCGGSVILQYLKDKGMITAQYLKLVKELHVGIRVMHVQRNPYDTIATRLLYQIGKKKKMKSAKFVVHMKSMNSNSTMGISDLYMNDSKLYHKRMKEKIRSFFEMVDAIVDFVKLVGPENVFAIHHRDLVHRPEQTIASITAFLGVRSEKKYLELCTAKIYKTVSRSRNLVIWPNDLKTMIESKIQEYEMLRGYSFVSD